MVSELEVLPGQEREQLLVRWKIPRWRIRRSAASTSCLRSESPVIQLRLR